MSSNGVWRKKEELLVVVTVPSSPGRLESGKKYIYFILITRTSQVLLICAHPLAVFRMQRIKIIFKYKEISSSSLKALKILQLIASMHLTTVAILVLHAFKLKNQLYNYMIYKINLEKLKKYLMKFNFVYIFFSQLTPKSIKNESRRLW